MSTHPVDELLAELRNLSINRMKNKEGTPGIPTGSANSATGNQGGFTLKRVTQNSDQNHPHRQDYVLDFWVHLQHLVNCFIHRMKIFFAPFQRDEALEACNSTVLLGLYWLVFVLVLFFLYYFRIQIQHWGPIYVWLSCLFMFTTLFAHYLLHLKWYYVVVINMGLIFVIHSIDYNTDNYLMNLDSQLGNAMFYHKLSHKLAIDESNSEFTVLNAVASLLKVTHACFSKGATVNNEQCHEELQMSNDLVNKYMVDLYSVMMDTSVVKANYRVSTGSMGNYRTPSYVSKEDLVADFGYKPIDQVQLETKQNLVLLATSRLLDGNRYENTVEDIARNTWYSFITASIPFKIVDRTLKFGQMWSSQPNNMLQMLSIGRLGFEFLSCMLDYAFPTQHRYKHIVHKFHPDVSHDASHIWNVCSFKFCDRHSMPLTDLALESRLKTQSKHIPSAYSKCPSLSDITDVGNTHIDMLDCGDFKKLCLQGMNRHNQVYLNDQWICPEACRPEYKVKNVCNCNNTKEYCLHKYPTVCNETFANESRVQNNFTCPVPNVTLANVTVSKYTQYNSTHIQWNESTCPNQSCSRLNGSAWLECHWTEAKTVVNAYFFTTVSTVLPLFMMRR